MTRHSKVELDPLASEVLDAAHGGQVDPFFGNYQAEGLQELGRWGVEKAKSIFDRWRQPTPRARRPRAGRSPDASRRSDH